jgi:putative ABC transport system substrate-binding protein
VRRREFITLLGGAAATWPITAGGQSPSIPVIGFINGSSATAYATLVQAFIRGLAETDHMVGENVAIEYRWAEGHYDRIPATTLSVAGLRSSLRTRQQRTLQSAPLARSRLSSSPGRIQSPAALSQA